MYKLLIVATFMSSTVSFDVLHSFNNISECENYAPQVVESLAKKASVSFECYYLGD